jgi:1-acyl-sn-glycerol-3-phosphate acyltransferase
LRSTARRTGAPARPLFPQGGSVSFKRIKKNPRIDIKKIKILPPRAAGYYRKKLNFSPQLEPKFLGKYFKFKAFSFFLQNFRVVFLNRAREAEKGRFRRYLP